MSHENVFMTLLCHPDLLGLSQPPPAAPSFAPCLPAGITYYR
jgi:hypothetical protein